MYINPEIKTKPNQTKQSSSHLKKKHQVNTKLKASVGLYFGVKKFFSGSVSQKLFWSKSDNLALVPLLQFCTVNKSPKLDQTDFFQTDTKL